MIQCETCTVWQHGRCLGISEATAPEGEYYCELCMPDHPIHVARAHAIAAADKKKSKKVSKGKKEPTGGATGRRKRARAKWSDDEEAEAPVPAPAAPPTHAPKEPPAAAKRRKSAADPPPSGQLDLLSTPSDRLTRDERKLKKLMETFQRMEERQKRTKEAESAAEPRRAPAAEAGGAEPGPKKGDKKGEEEDGPRSRLRASVRGQRPEKPLPRRAPRKQMKRPTPKPSKKAPKEPSSPVRTRAGPPSQPDRLLRLQLYPPAPGYLGRRAFLQKTVATEASRMHRASSGALGDAGHHQGHHARLRDSRLPLRQRLLGTWRYANQPPATGSARGGGTPSQAAPTTEALKGAPTLKEEVHAEASREAQARDAVDAICMCTSES